MIALLRLKTGSTPVIVLRNCVSDAGAKELADAMRKYGKQADLQALELPHNPQLGEEGIQSLVAAALLEGFGLQELDISFNPQLRSAAVSALRPLLRAKASKMDTLKLADCGLSAHDVQQLAEDVEKSSLRTLDLSCNDLTGCGEALATICEAPVLEELKVVRCGLRPDDVRELAEQLPYTSLKSLQIGGNLFGSEGLAALVEHLPKCQIDELGLEWNEIPASDLSSLGAAWAKRPFSRVRLNGNRMTPEEIATFVRTLRSIHG